jgi:hypothetical protein
LAEVVVANGAKVVIARHRQFSKRRVTSNPEVNLTETQESLQLIDFLAGLLTIRSIQKPLGSV